MFDIDRYILAHRFVHPLLVKGFNPQPEPPGRWAALGTDGGLSAVAFNPQPEPPGSWRRRLSI